MLPALLAVQQQVALSPGGLPLLQHPRPHQVVLLSRCTRCVPAPFLACRCYLQVLDLRDAGREPHFAVRQITAAGMELAARQEGCR